MIDFDSYEPTALQRVEFEREHFVGQIGSLTILVGPVPCEQGSCKWSVVIRHPERNDTCLVTSVFDPALGDFDGFRKMMCDYAINARESIFYASQYPDDLIDRPHALHS